MRLTSSSAKAFLAQENRLALVSITDTAGSTPRDKDALMLVSENTICGTIGGGVLEHMVIQRARAALAGEAEFGVMDVKLGPEIGQCCGGSVSLGIEHIDEVAWGALLKLLDEEHKHQRTVYIFGAGHIGAALAIALAPLPYHVIVVDTRGDILSEIVADVEKLNSAIPESVVLDAPANAAFVVLTHDHALDFLITKTALERNDAAYVGLIGSRTKRKKFESWFKHEGGEIKNTEALVCPIGSNGSGDKRPEIIAALVTAEIVTHLSREIPTIESPNLVSVDV